MAKWQVFSLLLLQFSKGRKRKLPLFTSLQFGTMIPVKNMLVCVLWCLQHTRTTMNESNFWIFHAQALLYQRNDAFSLEGIFRFFLSYGAPASIDRKTLTRKIFKFVSNRIHEPTKEREN